MTENKKSPKMTENKKSPKMTENKLDCRIKSGNDRKRPGLPRFARNDRKRPGLPRFARNDRKIKCLAMTIGY